MMISVPCARASSTKMELVTEYIKDLTVLRRFLFAATFLPPEYPTYVETVCRFAVHKTAHPALQPDIAKLLLENLKVLNEAAFMQDPQLTVQLLNMPNVSGKPTGIVLMPQQSKCRECGATLLVQADRPSHLALYTEGLGTVPARHYHKYCSNRRGKCKVVQYYGYATIGNHDGLQYDDEWNSLTYFVSSQETAFEMSMLDKFDAEMLIGQVSYKQKADIYNYQNGYYDTKKKYSTAEGPTTEVSRLVIETLFYTPKAFIASNSFTPGSSCTEYIYIHTCMYMCYTLQESTG